MAFNPTLEGGIGFEQPVQQPNLASGIASLVNTFATAAAPRQPSAAELKERRTQALNSSFLENLNRAQAPRLLGVDPEALRSRKAFTFVRPPHGGTPEELWMQLACDYDDDTVLCVGDEPTAVWGLDKGLGDELPYADERGRQFKLRLAAVLGGSILQGSLLISEKAF